MSWESYTEPKRASGKTHVSLQDIQEVWNALDERIKTVYDSGSGVVGTPELKTAAVITDERSEAATANKSVRRLLDTVRIVGANFARDLGSGIYSTYSSVSGSSGSITEIAANALGYSSADWDKIRGDLFGHWKDFLVVDELDICRKAIQLMTHVSLSGMTNTDTNLFNHDQKLRRDAFDASYETAKDNLFAETWESHSTTRFLRVRTNLLSNPCTYSLETYRVEGSFQLAQIWQDLGYSAFWQLESLLIGMGDLFDEYLVIDYGTEPSAEFLNDSLGDHAFTFYSELSPGSALLSGDLELYHRAAKDRTEMDDWPTPTNDDCGDATDQAWQNSMNPISGRPMFVGVPQYEYGDDPA